MKVETRHYGDGVPPLVLLIAETDAERKALDLLGQPDALTFGNVKLADGMREHYLQLHAVVPGCKFDSTALINAAFHEPVACFRATDVFAEDVVRHWLAKASVHGVSPAKIAGMGELLNRIAVWPHKKLPD
jgi:hypothetical protein